MKTEIGCVIGFIDLVLINLRVIEILSQVYFGRVMHKSNEEFEIFLLALLPSCVASAFVSERIRLFC